MGIAFSLLFSAIFLTNYQTTLQINGEEQNIEISVDQVSAKIQIKLAFDKIALAKNLNMPTTVNTTQISDYELTSQQLEYSTAYLAGLCYSHEAFLRILEITKEGALFKLFENRAEFEKQMTELLMGYLECAQETMGHPFMVQDQKRLFLYIQNYQPTYLDAYKRVVLTMLNYMDYRLATQFGNFDYEMAALNEIQDSLQQTIDIYSTLSLKPADSEYAQRIWAAKKLLRVKAIKGTNLCDAENLIVDIHSWVTEYSDYLSLFENRSILPAEEKGSIDLINRAIIEINAYIDFIFIDSSEEEATCNVISFSPSNFTKLTSLGTSHSQENIANIDQITQDLISKLTNRVLNSPYNRD